MTAQSDLKGGFKPPSFAEIEGVAVVTIPLADYKSLLEVKRLYAEANRREKQFQAPRRGMIDRNPQVAVFLAENFGTKPVDTILHECEARFGAACTPSKSAAYRYWDALKDNAPEG
ncbi:hypothetical protein [Agrobacterium pusense]|uniref:Uncharacterized protein n=1 Tax=Agrobacterium pusense TaxID=648995 RepID=A0AA44EK69_9HYPH|nr:hypothetical protein [Agrobacterium pusense]NRF09402.1 hypothetical protein [Agrobacterium pusense]NRF19693.1 hypothetical protein [Agrobacterium pusense]